MLVWWPYGQLSPILNPLRGLRRAANFTDYDAKALYRGQFIRSDSLPWIICRRGSRSLSLSFTR
jgi:hypothetical protein